MTVIIRCRWLQMVGPARRIMNHLERVQGSRRATEAMWGGASRSQSIEDLLLLPCAIPRRTDTNQMSVWVSGSFRGDIDRGRIPNHGQPSEFLLDLLGFTRNRMTHLLGSSRWISNQSEPTSRERLFGLDGDLYEFAYLHERADREHHGDDRAIRGASHWAEIPVTESLHW